MQIALVLTQTLRYCTRIWMTPNKKDYKINLSVLCLNSLLKKKKKLLAVGTHTTLL